MLREGVHASPQSNDQAVPELLTSPCSRKERLAIQQKESHDDAISNERRSHDEVGQTLAKMISLTEALRSDPAEQELHPSEDRQQTSQYGMGFHQSLSDRSQEAPLNVQPEIYSQHDLSSQDEHEQVRELGMSIWTKLSTLMHVSHEVAYHSDCGRSYLRRYMPSGLDEAEDHASRKQDAPCEGLDEDVYP